MQLCNLKVYQQLAHKYLAIQTLYKPRKLSWKNWNRKSTLSKHQVNKNIYLNELRRAGYYHISLLDGNADKAFWLVFYNPDKTFTPSTILQTLIAYFSVRQAS